MSFEFIKQEIPEVVLVKPKVFADERGFFIESYKYSEFADNGISERFLQDNHSKSSKGVLRGLHYQLNPRIQGKLVRCISGNIFDVAVDIRQGSPSFGKWVGTELTEDNKNMFHIPAGFAHGFLVLSDTAEIIYKTTDEYAPECDRGIKWDDPDIGIKWNIDFEPVISHKDANQPALKDAEINFVYQI